MTRVSLNTIGNGPILFVIGTRPEAIKLIPVIQALGNAGYDVRLCATFQHRELLQQVLDLFEIVPDISLDVMKPGQDLFHITTAVLSRMKDVLEDTNPSLVFVHGDTTTTMVASLAAFYKNIPLAHVEAGLRTGNKWAPFPEEINRRFTGVLATYHFAPTPLAVKNLLNEGVERTAIFCTGNTVVDALFQIKKRIDDGQLKIGDEVVQKISTLKKNFKKTFLLTAHRRESFGDPLIRIFTTLKKFLLNNPDIGCIYTTHPNPKVREALIESGFLDKTGELNASIAHQVMLLGPIEYQDMIFILDHINFVVTDSGGIQEEAVSLGVPVVCLREVTERQEAVWAGMTILVGNDEVKLDHALCRYAGLEKTNKRLDVYGDGHACERIVSIVAREIMPHISGSSRRQGYGGHSKSQNYFKHSELIKESGQYVSDAYSKHTSEFGHPVKKEEHMKVVVVGLGYIGLPTAVLAAQAQCDVVGIDINSKIVDAANKGELLFGEHEVAEALAVTVRNGNLRASTKLESADYFIITVPTPVLEDRSADLRYVWAAGNSIADVIQAGSTVILESTVPIGTTEKLATLIAEKSGLSLHDFYISHCPERVLPGNMMAELVNNDRVIGGLNDEANKRSCTFYQKFVRGELYTTTARMAEMVKLIENSSRDVQIAFANEVSLMCDAADLNPHEAIELANKHPRVKILQPGAGVGGHCIAVDPWFLINQFPNITPLMRTARAVNDGKAEYVAQQIKNAITEIRTTKSGPVKLAIFGLSFKPNVDDVRESPALHIAQKFINDVAVDLMVIEPHVNSDHLAQLGFTQIIDQQKALHDADVIAILVKHDIFKVLINTSVDGKKIIDPCGLFKFKSDQKNLKHVFPVNQCESSFSLKEASL